jgi:hypothetical protein
MADDLERVLRGFEKAQEFARAYRFEITDDYRDMLAQVEAMPQNQTGCDKSHVSRRLRTYLDTFRHARRVSREK